MNPGHGEGADVEGKVWRRRQRALNEPARGEQSTLLYPGKATFSVLELEVRVCHGLHTWSNVMNAPTVPFLGIHPRKLKTFTQNLVWECCKK